MTVDTERKKMMFANFETKILLKIEVRDIWSCS